MENIKLNESTQFIYNNKTMTVEQFMGYANIDTLEEAIDLVYILLKQGKATLKDGKTDREKELYKAKQQNEIVEIAEQLEEEKISSEINRRQEKNENIDLFAIELDFDSSMEAMKAEQKINSWGILDTSIIMSKGAIILKVENISTDEYSKIARSYKTKNAINKTVNVINSASSSATEGINYVAENIVAPVAKIGTSTVLGLGKGLAHTATKIGANTINASLDVANKLMQDIATDEEVITARANLREGVNAVKRFFKSKSSTGKGIRKL